ncbi:DUF169 domain-containing protein, partial [Pseudorhodoplanes sp.]|uniref:DUF169 domain-containing protein n=1 Tax=Pseudorhodoplanes sp. TaxID=1934341 RepID=UPI003D0EC761
ALHRRDRMVDQAIHEYAAALSTADHANGSRSLINVRKILDTTQHGYLASEEAGQIPIGPRSAKGILYGPLAEFPVEPYTVLCWLSPAQAMIWNEAAEDAGWKANKGSSVFGRPACAALAYSANHHSPVISFGCIGMRTFTEIATDRLLAVVPGTKLSAFSNALMSKKKTNDVMESAYLSRKYAFLNTPS